jgi:Bacterial regulatory proteins, crp family
LAFLLEMDRRHRSRKTIPLLMSRRDIANYLALTVETVARVLSHLRELGMISFQPCQVFGSWNDLRMSALAAKRRRTECNPETGTMRDLNQRPSYCRLRRFEN